VSVLAFDLGASGGKALIGELTDSKLVTTEIHRFSNDPVQVGDHLYWDILRIFHEIKQGLIKSRLQGFNELEGIAIDSWAVDFGLLGENGQLLGNPHHYRDHHTEGMMEKVRSIISDQELFSRTGIQFLPFNTIYQLYAMQRDPNSILKHADCLLMIPDLLRYFLTGEKVSEFTNASTTQLLNAATYSWDKDLIQQLGIPNQIFAKVIQPGMVVGCLLPSVSKELSIPKIPVIAVGEHDTACAVVAVPTEEQNFAYLSCGTWSLMGTEVDQPVLTQQALDLNFTNEGGIDHTFRLLKNIMGLWILQECKRAWEKEGKSITYAEMVVEAETAEPFKALIDPDDSMFLNPPNMPSQIRQYCQNTDQPVPQELGEYVRCVIESLALKYRYVFEKTEELSNKKFNGLHMVGGGIQNQLLCQFTANALGKQVWAGPIEASAIGNIVTQFITLGKIKNLTEARKIIKESFPIQTYEPQNVDEWKQVYNQFCQITG
jgi:rhamnulokinase